MKISYAITVCNEVEEFKRLFNFLTSNQYSVLKAGDEIVVLVDTPKLTAELQIFLTSIKETKNVKVVFDQEGFQGDFAAWKNKLNKACSGEFIYQIDADEYPSLSTLQYIHQVLDKNPDIELFVVPRRNTVEGLTQEDTQNWNWKVEEKDGQQLVNWPDWQFRIYRNNSSIVWKGKVHERPVNYEKFGFFPDMMCLYHPKTIEKQRMQNQLYSEIQNVQ